MMLEPPTPAPDKLLVEFSPTPVGQVFTICNSLPLNFKLPQQGVGVEVVGLPRERELPQGHLPALHQ